MTSSEHHRNIIREVHQAYRELFTHSTQAIYIYLDDEHKVCNKRFSDLLGYESPEEWAATKTPFAQAFVAEDSRPALVHAYHGAMQDCSASMVPVTWKTRDGGSVDTQVILVPIVYAEHLIALHFIS